MEYHNQLGGQLQQQQHQPHYSHIGGNSNGPASSSMMMMQQSFQLQLPDGSASSEKALMWNQYLPESGYSTQAPSISSHDAHSSSAYMTNQSTFQPAAAQQQQQIVAPPPQPEVQEQAAGGDNEQDNVTNWMNSQDNTEMALKAIPDLLNYLLDEDTLVVNQSSLVLNQMSRQERPRQALILTPNVVPCIVNALCHSSDMETVKNLVGALYGISTQKPQGGQVICQCDATLPLLIKLLDSGIENLVSYSITAIHNILSESNDQIKNQMRSHGAVQSLIPLLAHNHNPKFLAIVVDSLHFLTIFNQEAKMVMLNHGGTQHLIGLLYNHSQQYPKLIYNIVRLLKVLSICNNNKKMMVSMNAMQPLLQHIVTSSSANASGLSSMTREIIQNCLSTLRNLSDAAAAVPQGLAPFITGMFGFLATSQDPSQIGMAADIVSNLTAVEANKSVAIKANAIPILLKHISNNSGLGPNNQRQPKILDPCVCAIRHLTIRHADAFLVQEQVKSYQGLELLGNVMGHYVPRNWSVVKALLGVIRNFATNPANTEDMHKFNMIQNITTVLFDAFNIIQQKTNQGRNASVDVRLDGINLYEIVDLSAASLTLLAKDYNAKLLMRDLDCIGFFMQLFYSPLIGLQRPVASILVELANSVECAVAMINYGCRDFIQNNFLSQFGQMPPSANANNATLFQHVTTIYEKLCQNSNYC